MAVPAELQNEIPVIQAIQQGDRYALGELIARHGRWVRGLIYAQLGDAAAADDVLQSVWLRVWQQARSLRDARSWRPWLCQLARNAAFDEARRRQRERSGLEEVVSLEAVRQRSEPGPDVTLADDERRRLVQQAIRGLPAIYREPLVLRHLEDLSYREIAAVLGVPPDTVETRLVRARRLLREALGDGV